MANNEHTALAQRAVAWYEKSWNHGDENACYRFADVVSRYIDIRFFQYIDDTIDALPLEGKMAVLEFLDREEYNND